MPANLRRGSLQLYCLRLGASSSFRRERAGEPFRCVGAEILLEVRLAAAFLMMEEVDRERLPLRGRDDHEVERVELLVLRLRHTLRRIDVRRIAVVVHSEVTDV